MAAARKTRATNNTTRTPGESAEPEATDAVGMLDLVLPDATLGTLRRFRPDASMVRYAARLASRPGTVARRAGQAGRGTRRHRGGQFGDRPGSAATAGSLTPRGVRTRCSSAPSRPTWPSGGTAEELLADAELDWRDNTRLKFVLTNLIAASAPSNYPLINPAAWKAFIDTGGLSAVRGVRALVSDMSSAPHIPTMVAPDAFEVGKDLAVTPGAVVARTDVYELIQYKPTTPTVYQIPLLMVPPMINKYYITDLAPGRSMLEFFVAQGYQVFVLSWCNPGKNARNWDLDTYGQAIVDSISAAREITKAPKVNLMGLCAGGITLLDGQRAPGRDRAARSDRQPGPGRDAPGHDAGGHHSRADGRGHRRRIHPRLPHPRLHGRAHARRGVRLAPAR